MIASLLPYLEPSRLLKLLFAYHSAPPAPQSIILTFELSVSSIITPTAFHHIIFFLSRSFCLRIINMTSKEDIPPGDLVGKRNTPASDTMHQGKARVSDGGSLPRLMGPLTIRSVNMSCPPPVEARCSPEIAKGSEDETPSSPLVNKHDHGDVGHNNPAESSDADLSDVDSPQDNIDDQQNDDDESDFDDNIPIDDDDDDDDFFGDAVSEVAPCQPTEEQMDAIRKTMEEDEKAAKKAFEETMNQEAIRKVLTEDTEAPALVSNDEDDAPDPIVPPHPLLTDQNYNATEMLISIRSSFGGDVYHIVGTTEPLLEMKMKFVQAVNLNPSQLGTLEFLCGYHVIQDDDTVEKVCCSPHDCLKQVANTAAALYWTRINHPVPEDRSHALRPSSSATIRLYGSRVEVLWFAYFGTCEIGKGISALV